MMNDGNRRVDGGHLYLDPEDLLTIALEHSKNDRQRELIREAIQVGRVPAPVCGGGQSDG
jgi:hypothetical protein